MGLVSFFRTLFGSTPESDSTVSAEVESEASPIALLDPPRSLQDLPNRIKESSSHPQDPSEPQQDSYNRRQRTTQTASAPWWLPRGTATLTSPEQVLSAQTMDRQLYDRCVRTLDDPNVELPRLSAVVRQVLAMLCGPDSDLRQAAEVAGRDPALAAEVLRVVNSVAYRGITEIRRLDLAFARVGQRSMRSLLLTSMTRQVAINVGAAQRTVGEELWRRSLASGIIIGHLAPRYDLPEEEAFLVGLLHDIGMLAILKVVHDFQAGSPNKVSRSLFDYLCQQWHEHIGLRLAESWSLPDPIPEIAGSHHREPTADDPLKTYRLLVTFADAACAMLEYAPYVPYDFFNLPCVRQLGLKDEPQTHELLAPLPEMLKEQMESV